jgi:hypothetical protein
LLQKCEIVYSFHKFVTNHANKKNHHRHFQRKYCECAHQNNRFRLSGRFAQKGTNFEKSACGRGDHHGIGAGRQSVRAQQFVGPHQRIRLLEGAVKDAAGNQALQQTTNPLPVDETKPVITNVQVGPNGKVLTLTL